MSRVSPVQAINQKWIDRFKKMRQRVVAPELTVEGKLIRMVGMTLEAAGCSAPIGARCKVKTVAGREVDAEVVGFAEDKLYLMPVNSIQGITPNASVVPDQEIHKVPVGESLLGRVVSGLGEVMDGKGGLTKVTWAPLLGQPINPMHRDPISKPLDVGIQTINTLFTVGRGQRMGLFAGSGVGKSVLLGMMTKYTEADVIVVGLIGERGREVREFIERILGPQGMSRSVVVAAPADESPVIRLHAADYSLTLAEYFRDQGKNVLLLMDSLTRYAQAQREIGLAIGEPPATKGYPPSAFARIPLLVERAGNGCSGKGSITAFFTVLTESDDSNDPIADAARAILDGHIVLSRRLAEAGHYPAIDIEASISRVMTDIVSNAELDQARQVRRYYSAFEQNRDLIAMGAYQKGSDADVDIALQLRPQLLRFLQQNIGDKRNLANSRQALSALLNTMPKEKQ